MQGGLRSALTKVLGGLWDQLRRPRGQLAQDRCAGVRKSDSVLGCARGEVPSLERGQKWGRTAVSLLTSRGQRGLLEVTALRSLILQTRTLRRRGQKGLAQVTWPSLGVRSPLPSHLPVMGSIVLGPLRLQKPEVASSAPGLDQPPCLRPGLPAPRALKSQGLPPSTQMPNGQLCAKLAHLAHLFPAPSSVTGGGQPEISQEYLHLEISKCHKAELFPGR